MANYAATDARATLLFSRRRTGPNTEILDQMKVRLIRFDVERAGESVQYLEPLSDSRFSISSRAAGEDNDGLTPIEAIQFVEGNLIPSPKSGDPAINVTEVARFD